MTNLQRWLLYLGLFIVPYVGLLITAIQSKNSARLFELQLLPVVLLAILGVYCVCTVLYRTLTFRDCPEAAKELHDQIIEARRDLIAKGFRFRD